MVRFIGLLIVMGAMLAMWQPFNHKKPVDLETLEEKAFAAEDRPKNQSKIKATSRKTNKRQRIGNISSPPTESLISAQGHGLASTPSLQLYIGQQLALAEPPAAQN